MRVVTPTPLLRLPTSSERAFLLAAVGIAPGTGAARAPALDWSFLLPYAHSQLMLPALGHAMLDGELGDAVPRDAREALKDAAVHNEVQNRVLLADLADAVRALEAEGIASIAIKGAALLARSSRLLRTRHTDDIDLWVDPDRVFDADRVLRAQGYGDLGNIPHAAPRYDGGAHPERSPRQGHELPGLLSARGTPLEIHRHPPTEACARFRDALGAAEHADVGGVRVAVRGAVAMVRDLCTHVVLHHFALPMLWPRHLLDVMALLDDHTDLLTAAAAGASLQDRMALGVTSRVLAEARRADHDSIARRLVFPTTTRFGWGWYRLGTEVHQRLLEGPSVLARALWPSDAFLRARGFDPERGPLRARVAHVRDVLARARTI